MPLSPSESPGRIGLIAGRGDLVAIASRHLRERGGSVVAVGFDEETAATLEGLTDAFQQLRLGQLGKLISFFRKHEVDTVLMLGKIHKARMYSNVRPDGRALQLLARIADRRDDSILGALTGELEEEGLHVGRIDRHLRHLLAPAGKITRRDLDRRERADASLGWFLAKEIGRLDLGQTVVVKNRAPVAVEAIEGTDQTILRGGELAGQGTVVVKVSKPEQDFRFDVPVIGLDTARSLAAAGASALVVEAGTTLFVQREEMLPVLRKARIALVGCSDGDLR